jgi:hypothetical protein
MNASIVRQLTYGEVVAQANYLNSKTEYQKINEKPGRMSGLFFVWY